MTPKEIARDLIDRVSECGEDGEMYIETARQCALFTVNEILNTGCLGTLMCKYYEEVKEEIINLNYK